MSLAMDSGRSNSLLVEDVVGGKSARSEKELRGHRCNDGLHKGDKMGRVSQEAKRSDK